MNVVTNISTYVGINTPFPAERLTITDGNLLFHGNTTYPKACITQQSTTSRLNIGPDCQTAYSGAKIELHAKNDSWRPGELSFQSNVSPQVNTNMFSFYNSDPAINNNFQTIMNMRIDGTTPKITIGNVSDQTPGVYSLYVENGILTEKVRVAVKTTSSWADHVFASDYRLPSMSELGNYIAQHKHLPNIPSAQKVVTNGVDIAEMDALLLQKIEELTLYALEQHQEISQMKNEIRNLKKAMRHEK
ncbi:MAG: hypothetical protein JST52_08520 [Bacteroidetes bacterium]|nr:hypothetical protein [Bacteroidota bacterium]MBS1740946.1 hypothetical protein [Bacteroidota bacterium]